MTLGARIVSLYALVAVAGVTCAPAAARADETSARRHYEAGERALADGDTTRAAEAFRTAYRARPEPETLLAIAVAYERAGDELATAAYYWWYLNSGAATGSEQAWLFPKIVALTGDGASAAAVVVTKPVPVPRPAPEKAKPVPRPAPEKATPLLAPKKPMPAPGPAPRLPADRATQPRWYGLPLLVTEGVSFAILIGGVESDTDGAVAIGILGVMLSGPIVHTYYGHGRRGWGSLGLRFLGTGLGGLAGEETGALVGYLSALALDSLLIARDEVPIEPSVTPTVNARDGSVTFGLAGRF